jgi:hypothetical protein
MKVHMCAWSVTAVQPTLKVSASTLHTVKVELQTLTKRCCIYCTAHISMHFRAHMRECTHLFFMRNGVSHLAEESACDRLRKAASVHNKLKQLS